MYFIRTHSISNALSVTQCYDALLCLNISYLCPVRFKSLLGSSSSDGSQHCKEIEISDVKYNIFQVSAADSLIFLFCVRPLSSKT